jgi:cell division protease FtsH
MKQIKTIRSLILCALSFSAIIQAEITEPQEIPLTASQQAEIIKTIEFADKAIIKAFNSLQKIENTLTEVALLVRKGALHIPVTKLHEIMELLTENKMTVNALLNNQAELIALQNPIMQLEYAYLITEFCNAFIPYFNEHIKNGFKDAKPFNLKRFVIKMNQRKTRSHGQHLKPESLKKGLIQTRAELVSLHHNVKNIGLVWYNKVARTIDEYVVTPANRWHIPTIAYYGGSAALFSLYSLLAYGSLFRNNPHTSKTTKDIIDGLTDTFGHPLTKDAMGIKLVGDSDNPLASSHSLTNASKFATFDLMINELMANGKPLATLAAGHLYTSFSETWAKDIYPKLTRKRDDIWNFLRGGEYRNTQRAGLAQIKPTYTFNDMVGLDEVKKQFAQIIQYIDDPEQLMRIEATPEKGWLLTGPARTGKSFSVECLCGEIELLMKKRGKGDTIKFFNIDAFLVNKYGIKDILEQVSENAPAVIFIDEIDLLGLQRVGNNQLLSDFLTAMQSSMNADPSKIVIIIAATNNPQNIDQALRKNGRFGKEICFEAPARKYRIQYIKRELRNMALDLSKFDLEALADKTNSKTFEDLKAIIRNAMTRAWLQGESLTQTLLEHSIDTEMHHIITSESKELPEPETRILATHFAGRALAALHLEMHTQLDKVTIYPRMADLREEGVWANYEKKEEKDHQQRIEYGFIATKQTHDSISVKKETTIINEATALIAGFAAEELLLGSCGFTCHSNSHDRAFKLIEDLVFGGLKPDSLPKNVKQELKLKAYNLLQQCHVDAMKLLQDHQNALISLVDELMNKKIMTDKEVQAVIDKAEGRTSSYAEATEDRPTIIDTDLVESQDEIAAQIVA